MCYRQYRCQDQRVRKSDRNEGRSLVQLHKLCECERSMRYGTEVPDHDRAKSNETSACKHVPREDRIEHDAGKQCVIQ